MTRVVSVLNQAALDLRDVVMFIAVDLDFPTGHVYVHDGIGTYSFGGHDYLGVGKFGGVEVAEESLEVIAKPVTLSLSGVDSEIIATAMDNDVYQGRDVVIYLGLVNKNTLALVDTPETLWEGRMDQMSIKFGANEASVTLNCEHRLRREPRIARYTDADQQISYPGDRFFDYVGKIPGFAGNWGGRNDK